MVVVDKPQGWTSHDVVGRLRRLCGTKKVGHAGTLDPMATGVLVAGVGRGTKLLTYLVGADKTYDAVIRLGVATVTEDAEGEVTSVAETARVEAVTDEAIAGAVSALTGPIRQVPSAVSAIKVDGKRSYARVRAGEDVQLDARSVTVSRFEVHEVSRHRLADGSAVIDLSVTVDVSSGTYVRALARDLGEALGIHGHLTALRRTRVGSLDLSHASDLERLRAIVADGGTVPATSLDEAARAMFPVRELSQREALDLSHGKRIPATGTRDLTAAFDPEGRVVALVEDRGNPGERTAKPVLVLRAR
ncbi:tRNA pseudouridine(55) synthase TruB [Kocuria coralli]|uniref:tRNA pseudouridine(55) synthase TruB n=1 Tax=Kocuria coralli TaxID=1461025 RepID=UPI001FE32BBB|nr:tRNA pseudouridine(55) synthase TruB [Kocuria coralli]